MSWGLLVDIVSGTCLVLGAAFAFVAAVGVPLAAVPPVAGKPVSFS